MKEIRVNGRGEPDPTGSYMIPEPDDECRNERLAQTYVHYRDGAGPETAFMVSTINRRSSSAYNPCVFAETLVWEWFPQAKERGRLIGQDGARKGSLSAHQRMVQRLFDTGQCEIVGVNEV